MCMSVWYSKQLLFHLRLNAFVFMWKKKQNVWGVHVDIFVHDLGYLHVVFGECALHCL